MVGPVLHKLTENWFWRWADHNPCTCQGLKMELQDHTKSPKSKIASLMRLIGRCFGLEKFLADALGDLSFMCQWLSFLPVVWEM